MPSAGIYYITLTVELRSLIKDKGLTENKVQVQHFHGWCSEKCKAFNIKVPIIGLLVLSLRLPFMLVVMS